MSVPLDDRTLAKLIGEALKTKRLRRKLRLADVANATNLSVGYLSQVENGFGCRTHTTYKIARALGWSISALFLAVEKAAQPSGDSA